MVSDLSVAGTDATSANLRFTQVGDGAGQPANYDVRFQTPTINWGPAASVSQGTCSVPLVATGTAGVTTCTVEGLSAATDYEFQLVAFRGTLNGSATFGPLSNVAAGRTLLAGSGGGGGATGGGGGELGSVNDLSVTDVGPTGLTLRFTEVEDGAGRPARYDVRFDLPPLAWGAALPIVEGTCKMLEGSQVGVVKSCTVLGLSPSTDYEFQLVPYRGTLNVDAVFRPRSNVVAARTLAQAGSSGGGTGANDGGAGGTSTDGGGGPVEMEAGCAGCSSSPGLALLGLAAVRSWSARPRRTRHARPK